MLLKTFIHRKKTKKILTLSLILFLVLFGYYNPRKNSSVINNVSIFADDSVSTHEYFEGYNLYILERENTETHSIIDRKILLTDLDNNIINEKKLGSNSVLSDIKFINSSTILYGDNNGIRMWNIETNVSVDLGFGSHHEIAYNYRNNTFLALGGHIVDINGTLYNYDLINEYNSSGILVRSLDTQDYVEPWQICPYANVINVTIDITHANSISFDEDENAIYLNCRNTNTFYKIDYATGDLIWGLGEYGNFTMFDIYGNQKDFLFFHCHSLEKIAENKFLLFDNDFHNQTNAIDKQSRYVEITTDSDKMYANVTREWNSPTDYFSSLWGDCNLLPNDNLLGVFSYTMYQGKEIGSKLVEVNEEGEIVWILESPIEQEIKYTVNKVERFRFTPFVSNPKVTEEGDSIGFDWKIWYNFNAKTEFSGEYYIYLDNRLLLQDNLTFPKYWQPTQVNCTLKDLEPGNHMISIIVKDEDNHFSNESEFYNGEYLFKVKQSEALILGISLGIGIPVLIVTIIISWKFLVKLKKYDS